MLKLIRSAALAATLSLAPAATLGLTPVQPATAPAPAVAMAPAAAAAPAPVPAEPFGLPGGHEHEHDHGSGLAPGQGAAEFRAWLDASPAHRAELARFEARLAAEGVDQVVPL